MVVKVVESSVKGGERVSLDRRTSHYHDYDIRRLASTLEYVTERGVKTDLRDQLQGIEERIEYLHNQRSQHYTEEPFSSGTVKVTLIPGRMTEVEKIKKRIASLSNEKENIESRLRDTERTYGKVADSIKEAMFAKLARDLPGSDRAEAHRVLLSRVSSPVVDVYYDNGEKVLVLDDVIGRVLEVEGHVRLPHNVVSPNGNPLTSRAATNLCIGETPNGNIFGVYRGYGEPVEGKNEGKSSLFPMSFKEDDTTPVKPLPQNPLFPRSWPEEAFGDEDLRFIRYNGGYFGTYVAAKELDDKSIEYCGAGVILSLDLKVEDRFLFMGLPKYAKDFVPRGKVNGHYVMEFRPSPPDRAKSLYPKFYKEHPGIWIAKSDDLKLWEVFGEVLRPLEGESKIGGGSPPVKEPEGEWNYIHGVKGEDRSWREYYGRAVLFEAGNPTKPIAMTPNFLMPEDYCDRNDEYKIRHVFPMGVVKRRVETGGRRYSAHIVSAGTADKESTLFIVSPQFLNDVRKPINAFKFAKN